MSRALRGAAAAGVGYAIGSLPGADLVARLAGGGDLREVGTRNPGALNAAHVLGRRWGAVVAGFDVGKGVVAARVGQALAGDDGANVAAAAAVTGHCFPPGRRGGKGVATSVGQVVATFPTYLPVDVGVALTTASLPWMRQRTRAATAVASVTWVGCATLWWRRGMANPGGVRPTASLPIAAAISSGVIAVRFRADARHVDAFNRGTAPRAEAA